EHGQQRPAQGQALRQGDVEVVEHDGAARAVVLDQPRVLAGQADTGPPGRDVRRAGHDAAPGTAPVLPRTVSAGVGAATTSGTAWPRTTDSTVCATSSPSSNVSRVIAVSGGCARRTSWESSKEATDTSPGTPRPASASTVVPASAATSESYTMAVGLSSGASSARVAAAASSCEKSVGTVVTARPRRSAASCSAATRRAECT